MSVLHRYILFEILRRSWGSRTGKSYLKGAGGRGGRGKQKVRNCRGLLVVWLAFKIKPNVTISFFLNVPFNKN